MALGAFGLQITFFMLLSIFNSNLTFIFLQLEKNFSLTVQYFFSNCIYNSECIKQYSLITFFSYLDLTKKGEKPRKRMRKKRILFLFLPI